MTQPAATHHIYTVTVSGETATLAGPDDIVEMYVQLRSSYPRGVSVELKSLDDDLRLHHAPLVEKVDSYHGNH